jgi:OmpA-like transmembrane domain.
MTFHPARHSAKQSMILFVALGLVFSGLAQAATPHKRTRNQNRVGPYGAAFVGQTNYRADQSNNEQTLEDILALNDIPFQNLSSKTEEKDIGYQATFGFRFHRFFSAEIGLVQYGEMVSSANAELDFPDDDPIGYIPAKVSLGYRVGGVLFSGLAILPIRDKIELYGRVGYLFANSEREFISRVEGQQTLSGSAKGDSQDLVLGLGVGWNINVIYSIRAEYQRLSDVGSPNTGTEDFDFVSLGLIVRF